MLRITTALLAVGLLTSSSSAGTVRDALEGHALQTLDGQTVSLDDLEGRTVVLNFWAEWCGPCRRELPVLDRWYKDLEGRDVVFVAVSIDREARKAKRLADKLDLDLPMYHDGPDELAATLDLPSLPITYVVGPDGRTIYTSNGSDRETLDELHAAIVAATPRASTTTTRGADR